MSQAAGFVAFAGARRIAAGSLPDVAAALSGRPTQPTEDPVYVFDMTSGRIIDLDLSGTESEVRARYGDVDGQSQETPKAGPRGPGRPRLGVVAREVTLLPRHWDWLGNQPGGASVALRKLVDEARQRNRPRDELRARQTAAYCFLAALAGDWPNFEESVRALFAGDSARFGQLTEDWPADVRDHARQLASAAFASGRTDVYPADALA